MEVEPRAAGCSVNAGFIHPSVWSAIVQRSVVCELIHRCRYVIDRNVSPFELFDSLEEVKIGQKERDHDILKQGWKTKQNIVVPTGVRTQDLSRVKRA